MGNAISCNGLDPCTTVFISAVHVHAICQSYLPTTNNDHICPLRCDWIRVNIITVMYHRSGSQSMTFWLHHVANTATAGNEGIFWIKKSNGLIKKAFVLSIRMRNNVKRNCIKNTVNHVNCVVNSAKYSSSSVYSLPCGSNVYINLPLRV